MEVGRVGLVVVDFDGGSCDDQFRSAFLECFL
jgi:hypothetical protein